MYVAAWITRDKNAPFSFRPEFPDSLKNEARTGGFQVVVVVRIMYAEEAIRASAALSPFPPKHVVPNVFDFSPRPAHSFLHGWIFLLVRLLPSPG